MSELSRRTFLAASGAALGAAWLNASPEQLDASLVHAAIDDAPLEVLTPEQAADLDALTAQIIPSDDLPGAREARVVAFIDHSLATWAANQKDFLIAGLTAWNGSVSQRYGGVQRFAQLTVDQQLEFLRANDRNGFFQQIRFATIVGTFSNPANGGNFEKAGYRILGYDDRYVWQPPFGWYDDKANGGPN